jgi:hypothetical protein
LTNCLRRKICWEGGGDIPAGRGGDIPAGSYAAGKLSNFEDILEGQEGHAYLPDSTQLTNCLSRKIYWMARIRVLMLQMA